MAPSELSIGELVAGLCKEVHDAAVEGIDPLECRVLLKAGHLSLHMAWYWRQN